VTVIDNLHTGKKENLDGFLNQIEFLEIDMLDYENLRKAVKNINGLFHHAALTKVQESYIKQLTPQVSNKLIIVFLANHKYGVND